jgi:hypothetical protein
MGRLTARKLNRRARRSNMQSRRFQQRRADPYAMSTVMATNLMDPPQTSTNVVGFKRLRKVVTTAPNTGLGSLTLGNLRSCLPLTDPELRVIKLSVWAPDAGPLSCVFPVGSSNNSHPGDDAAWSDEGVPGQSRSQIHITPAFDYRNFWWPSSVSADTLLATFVGNKSQQGGSLLVDVTVQYRTGVQSCPALLYLQQLRSEAVSSE